MYLMERRRIFVSAQLISSAIGMDPQFSPMADI